MLLKIYFGAWTTQACFAHARQREIVIRKNSRGDSNLSATCGQAEFFNSIGQQRLFAPTAS
jgi:hypothetical protein